LRDSGCESLNIYEYCDGEVGDELRYIKKFPAPAILVTGNSFFQLVAGAGDAQQLTQFPPVDVVELPLERRRNVLVPIAA
jgi:hypothetical protein